MRSLPEDAPAPQDAPVVARPTPMMEQYIEIKAANPDCLLFYRMGDFYEMFFGDAEVASRALGIALTKRGKHLGDDIPMCGVPIHAADDYLQKLIALGHRVAVCEQLEDPAEAKKRGAKSVVRRDVVRLVTPGTITEENLLDAGRPNWLAALSRLGGGDGPLGLAWIDISTGAFRVGEVALAALPGELSRIEPRELLVPDGLLADAALAPLLRALPGRTPATAVTPLPRVHFDGASAAERLARFYGVATLDGFGAFTRPELSAAAAALSYVERTQLSARPPLDAPRRETAGAAMAIDAATRSSLEITRTQAGERAGSLFSAVDRTVTGGGARLLAERLSSPLTDPTEIGYRHDAVGWLLDEADRRTALRTDLARAPDIARALSRLALDRGGPRDLGAVAAGLMAAAEIAATLDAADAPQEIADARAALVALPETLSATLADALADSLPHLKRDGSFVRPGHRDDLDEARALRDESRQVIARLQGTYAEETGIRALKIRHNAVLGWFVETPQVHGEKLLAAPLGSHRFVHRQTMAGAVRFTTPELAELEQKIAGAAERALAIELTVFAALVEAVVATSEALKRAASALSVLDVTAALAELAERERWTRPVVERSLAFRVVAGRHPVVEAALRREAADPFVPNDADLGPPPGEAHGRLVIVTGPNMGGKSTYLRQNALIAVLAQAGSYVPAAEAHLGVVDRLFSRVGAADDLARGRSTFMVEMVETAAILNLATERSLVVLDEIGRGTATYDGLSIAWAAIEHLHGANRCRTLFATHYHELTALAGRLARVANATVKVKEWKGDVVFLHEIVPGAADRSYGIQVARLAGLPAPVIARAKAVLVRLESTGRTGTPSAALEDLPLFSAPARPAATAAAAPDPALALLDEIQPDDLTPRAALEALYRLKAARTAGPGEAS